MSNTRVKFCGLRTPSDVDAAIGCGVDAVGFVFVPQSPRYITIQDAIPLVQSAQQAGVTAVALFANQEASFIADVVNKIKPDVIQFHGDEEAEFCQQFNRPYWKAVPMLTVNDYSAYVNQHPSAAAYLLDAYGRKQSGGSGRSFEWFKIPEVLRDSMILAGGIHAENVRLALQITAAKYIDTSSGIEASPGVKSRSKMKALMDEVKSFDDEKNN